MVGDAKILKTSRSGRVRHGLKRFRTVRGICMAMQNAAKVAVLDQLGQLSFLCALNFAAPFAQLRLDEWQIESRIDLLFAFGYHLAALVQPIGRKAHGLLSREGRELIEMFCRSRCVQQGSTEMPSV